MLLIAYPVLIALLIGFAISRDPGKPRVAFLNEIPQGARIAGGNGRLPAVGVNDRICKQVECADVDSRDEAAEKVRSGNVLAALILPADLIDRLNSLSTLSPETPEVEVIVNQEDPLDKVVDDRITALLAQANLFIARQIAKEGGRYLDLVVDGRATSTCSDQPVEILGLPSRRCDPAVAAPGGARGAAWRPRPGDPASPRSPATTSTSHRR